VQWIQQRDYGFITTKDVIEGKISETTCDDDKCCSTCFFQAIDHEISVINAFGIMIPGLRWQQQVKDYYSIDDIEWNIEDDVLLVEFKKDYFVFVRKPPKDKNDDINFNKFLLGQFLGYLFVKAVDHSHLIN